MFLAFAVGAAAGILSGLGIGGGSLLLLYLTAVVQMAYHAAAGCNLLYFIVCAPAALYSHIKNHLVVRQVVCWCVLAGLPVSLLAAFAAGAIDTALFRRLFGLLLLYIGLHELRAKPSTSK